MQNTAERELIDLLIRAVRDKQATIPMVLNIGAGRSSVIENSLLNSGWLFICDRTDIEDCSVDHPNVRYCYRCSVERMEEVHSASYDCAFSNYVLEHVQNLSEAAAEISRVLKPGGIFLATVPNTTALEFIVSRHTPLWFHQLVRGGSGWETHYSYRSIPELCAVFSFAGLETTQVSHSPCVRSYMQNTDVLKQLAQLYDWAIARTGWKRLMGHVCVTVRKTDRQLAPETT